MKTPITGEPLSGHIHHLLVDKKMGLSENCGIPKDTYDDQRISEIGFWGTPFSEKCGILLQKLR